MQNTTNYNLLLAEGTDLVNYLTQTNPNFTNLDTIIKNVSDATVTTATEVTVGTAHAIARTLPDANVIRFVATSNWVTGDTMTVDGTPVTPLKTDGTTLKSGDYIIGATVIGVLDSTRFTVFVSSAAPTDAADVTYDNTSSGLTATNVQNAIDEINSNLPVRFHTQKNVVVDTSHGNIFRSGQIAIDISSLNLSSISHVEITTLSTDDCWCCPESISTSTLYVLMKNGTSVTGNVDFYITIYP